MKLKTLKRAREARGLSQVALAQRANIPAPYICYCESGSQGLSLRAMIMCEKTLGQRIDWDDAITDRQKREIVELIASLAERYPLTEVLAFAAKTVATDMRTGNPAVTLDFYCRCADATEDNVLLPGIIN